MIFKLGTRHHAPPPAARDPYGALAQRYAGRTPRYAHLLGRARKPAPAKPVQAAKPAVTAKPAAKPAPKPVAKQAAKPAPKPARAEKLLPTRKPMSDADVAKMVADVRDGRGKFAHLTPRDPAAEQAEAIVAAAQHARLPTSGVPRPPRDSLAGKILAAARKAARPTNAPDATGVAGQIIAAGRKRRGEPVQ